MKLIRFGQPGREKPGFIDENEVRRDLSSVFNDWDRDFFSNNGIAKIKALDNFSEFPAVSNEVRLGSCVARPGKVLCIGLNYSDHAAESGMPMPSEPIVFQKAANTVVGPNDNIIIPRNSKKTDWEIELGVVIGKEARYLDSASDALDYIAGYCICNDVSERAFQLERGGQWTKGKSCDNFNPLGPWLLTTDELPDVQHLNMQLKVNGQRKQCGNTKTMIFDCFYLVHYLSQFMTLEAGDLISTGTPPGVGLGMTPPQYLQSGDIVELSIDKLGYQRQVCVQAHY